MLVISNRPRASRDYSLNCTPLDPINITNYYYYCTRIEPMTSAIPVQCSTSWATRPTGSWPRCEFIITRRWWRMQVNICYGEWYEDMINHRSYAHNLSSCSLVFFTFYILNSGLNFFQALISQRINHVFITFSAVQVYWIVSNREGLGTSL